MAYISWIIIVIIIRKEFQKSFSSQTSGLLCSQSSCLDGDDGHLWEDSVPQEKLAFASPGWPRGWSLRRTASHFQREQRRTPSTAGRADSSIAEWVQSAAPSRPPQTPLTNPAPLGPLYPAPPQSGGFPRHPKDWISCREGESADKRDAEDPKKSRCSRASNPTPSPSWTPLAESIRHYETPIQPRRPHPRPFGLTVLAARAAAADAARAPRQRWELTASRTHRAGGVAPPARRPRRPGRGEMSRSDWLGKRAPSNLPITVSLFLPQRVLSRS